MAKLPCVCGCIHARLPESGNSLLHWELFAALSSAVPNHGHGHGTGHGLRPNGRM